MATDGIDPLAVARELFPDLPLGFPYENFETEELILPADDDMGIKSDDDDVREEDVQTESGFGCVAVLVGLPKVAEEKFETLLTKVVKGATKRFSGGADPRDNGVFMPLDDAKMTKGYAFVEFPRKEDVDVLMKSELGSPAGWKLDKQHTLYAYRFDDFEKYGKVPDEYVAYQPPAYKEPENMASWLADKFGRDQFVIRHGNSTSICWNDGKRGRADLAYERTNWTESFVQWSPQGTMIATVHRQGVALWAGPTFVRLNRYMHDNVRLIDFSPNEKYLVTYTSEEPATIRDSFQVKMQVFDVTSGKLLRPFEGPADEFAVSNGPISSLKWPVFKWAGGREDRYFAKLSRGKISVYQAPDMLLLDNKSIPAENVQDIEWSPSEPILAAYLGEQGNQPAKIILYKLPSRDDSRQKVMSLDVKDVKMLWHPQGTYLGVRVESWTKTKKNSTNMFLVFSVKDKDVPVETFRLPNENERIHAFAWEPKGHRLAIVHGMDNAKSSISFYSMRDPKTDKLAVKPVGTLVQKNCTNIYWSPQGKYIVFASLKGSTGTLEFFSVDDMDTMQAAEHFMATDVEWDPTGRYVASIVSSIQAMENGVRFYTFAGKELYQINRDKLFQFNWRPRPPSLLPEDREREIQKNLKTFSKRYEEEDELLLQAADQDVLQERQKFMDEWNAFMERRRQYAQLVLDFKKELYGPRFAEKEYTLQKVLVEQVVEIKEEPYNTK